MLVFLLFVAFVLTEGMDSIDSDRKTAGTSRRSLRIDHELGMSFVSGVNR